MDIQEFADRFHNLVLQPHHLEWIEFLESIHRRGILLAPRGHGKTTTINLVYLSWLIATNPTIRILLVSHSKDMAESFSRSVRSVMENEQLQEEFGFKTGTPWRANSWRLEGSPMDKPTLECKGAMGRMAGWRGDMVIFDDLLESTMITSQSMMLKLVDWIKIDVLPAINPTPMEKVIVVGTRKSIDDWYGELLETSTYKKRVDQAFLNEEETKTLWPQILDKDGGVVADAYTAERLHERKEEIGALRFAQEYMNQPSPPGGLFFKYEWLRFYEHLPRDYGINYYMGIDPSHGSTQKRASYFALCVVAHDTIKNKIYVCDFYRNKMSPNDQVQKSIEYAEKYNLSSIYVENVFKYTHVYEAMRERFHNVYPIDYMHTKLKGTSVVNKEERIKNICSPPIELGKVYFKRPELDPYTKQFINYEYVAFPFGDDDMFDALTLAIHRVAGLRYSGDVPFFSPD